jgi:hypothetical protein
MSRSPQAKWTLTEAERAGESKRSGLKRSSSERGEREEREREGKVQTRLLGLEQMWLGGDKAGGSLRADNQQDRPAGAREPARGSPLAPCIG